MDARVRTSVLRTKNGCVQFCGLFAGGESRFMVYGLYYFFANFSKFFAGKCAGAMNKGLSTLSILKMAVIFKFNFYYFCCKTRKRIETVTKFYQS